MYMYSVHVYTYIYTYICVYIYPYACASTYRYTYTYTHIYIHVHIYIYNYAFIYHTYMHTCIISAEASMASGRLEGRLPILKTLSSPQSGEGFPPLTPPMAPAQLVRAQLGKSHSLLLLLHLFNNIQYLKFFSIGNYMVF